MTINTAVETRETINVLTGAALTREMKHEIDAASAAADAQILDEILDILKEAEKKKRGEIEKTNV